MSTVVASDKAHDLLKAPASVAIVRSTGDVIVADTAHHRILRIAPAGDVIVLAGSGKPGHADGIGVQAQFKEPEGVAVDDMRGVIYVADSGNHLVRSVTFGGAVATLAGSGRPEDKDGPGAEAGFKQPSGIAVDATGMIVVADGGNSRIKQVTPAGQVTTIAGDVHAGFADGPAN
ncbi:MAG: gluconolaconase, partial [bacterium]